MSYLMQCFPFFKPSSRNSIPLSGNSSRRGSGDTSSLLDPDASLSELRVNCIAGEFGSSLKLNLWLGGMLFTSGFIVVRKCYQGLIFNQGKNVYFVLISIYVAGSLF